MTERGHQGAKRKPNHSAAEAFKPSKAYPLAVDPDNRDNTARSSARLASVSTVAATRVIAAAEGKTGVGELLDIPGLIVLMREQATAVQGGSLAEAEAMLINQATALQALFVRLIERGVAQEGLSQYEAHMRLGLRAQNQCRATLETLATIKNPPIVYARQANVTTGPQQINNGTAVPAHAREIQSTHNQLSGGTRELLPNTRASGIASGTHPAMEAVGKSDRAEDRRG
ncbi:MAG: hypothetical protein JNM37_01830 [Rhodocyclaceae bacterium]|nr:hypothetical protein [Rhodocyclaceae bacterium]